MKFKIILLGLISLFAYSNALAGSPVIWNTDCPSGVEAVYNQSCLGSGGSGGGSPGGVVNSLQTNNGSGGFAGDAYTTYSAGVLNVSDSSYNGTLMFGNAGQLYNDGFGNVLLNNLGLGQQLAFDGVDL